MPCQFIVSFTIRINVYTLSLGLCHWISKYLEMCQNNLKVYLTVVVQKQGFKIFKQKDI